MYNGDPAGPGAGDPQQRNRTGLNFRVNDPPLVISEVQIAWKNTIGIDHRPGTLKIGGWHHFGTFADKRFDTAGLSLADSAGSGTARRLRGDDGLYAVFEQRLYTMPSADARGISVFIRASTSPADRNLIDIYADGGLDLIGLWGAPPHDKFGIAFGYAHVSPRAAGLDRDFQLQNGFTWPVRRSEALTTVSYSYEVQAGWNLLPSVQYIMRPGGGATDPLDEFPGHALHAAAVFGLRSIMKF